MLSDQIENMLSVLDDHATTSSDAEFVLSLRAAIIEALEAAKPKWIPVSERLPESSTPMKSVKVWAYAPRLKRMREARYVDTLGWQLDGDTSWDDEITHWQPLPEAPDAPNE
jgi:hypothetical protein